MDKGKFDISTLDEMYSAYISGYRNTPDQEEAFNKFMKLIDKLPDRGCQIDIDDANGQLIALAQERAFKTGFMKAVQLMHECLI